MPKLRSGSFFPEDAVERYRRVDHAVVAAVAGTCATGTSTRKVQRVAERLGISRLLKDQVSAIARNLDEDVAELLGSQRIADPVPVAGRDLRQVQARGRVCSTAVVTTIGCDEGGWRRATAPS